MIAADQGRTVDLLLVLAIDCSYSVDTQEYDLQRQGIAHALRDPEIRQAISAGPYASIAIAVVQWSSATSQVLALPWTLLDGPASIDAAIARIGGLKRATRDGATAISTAIGYSLGVLDRSPYRAVRRIIDISGDGRHNNGPDLEHFRLTAAARGVTVNALAILNEEWTLDLYYKDKVIAGFGAFVERANAYPDYRDAIRRKMLREIRYVPVSQAPGTLSDVATPFRANGNRKGSKHLQFTAN
ncbi:DUF1194 domain-containing protein [Marivibrio halodurans]|uniref:DUF1194 domain-containing protein n=1 Tax=Marivibrio halodurans TaxID=2039722 RepID=A0A8J7RVB3_9PROT|nr:DUF1194 domain-containing protein [Marivibrio halodurans]MBP5855377.1 DUF1194 domain-containing protein [Marivibrio halodurans]